MIARYRIRHFLSLSRMRAALLLPLIVTCPPVPGRASRQEGAQSSKALAAPLPIEDPGGDAMRAFYESLMLTEARLPRAITRILHYGDSHVAADILTGELRRKFQTGFGYGGPGFILPGRPWQGYSPHGVRTTTSPGWETRGLKTSQESDRRFGLAGMSLETQRPDEWIRVDADCRRFEIYLLTQLGGGAVQVTMDGKVYRRVSLASQRAAATYLEVTARTDGAHSVEIRTISAGAVRVLGVAVEREIAGVVYDALGINGARANRLLEWDWKVFADNLEHRDPKLIIVAYGSNEVGDADLDLEVYGRTFSALLGRLRTAVPGASLLVVSPPDRAIRVNGEWQTIARMRSLVAAQRKAALEAGAAFWDFFSVMGGSGSIQRWATRVQPLAQPDRVHLTREGYRLAAEMLYAELMRGYLWELVGGVDRQ